jgi:hypothetical protein
MTCPELNRLVGMQMKVEDDFDVRELVKTGDCVRAEACRIELDPRTKPTPMILRCFGATASHPIGITSGEVRALKDKKLLHAW